MSQKGEVIESIISASKPVGVTVIGSGMAAGPAFYESSIWLSCVAILGITVLVLTAANGILALRKNLKWNGEDRRSKR